MHIINLADKLSRLLPGKLETDVDIADFIQEILNDGAIDTPSALLIIQAALSGKLSNIDLPAYSQAFIKYDANVRAAIDQVMFDPNEEHARVIRNNL